MFKLRPTPARGLLVVVGLAVLAASLAHFDGGRGGRPKVLPGTENRVPAVPLCGVADVATVAQPTAPTPQSAVHVVAGGFAVSSFVAADNELFALDQAAQVVRRLGLDGAALGSFKVDFRLSAQSMAVDPQGNVYLAQYPANLVKLSPGGVPQWSRTVGLEISGVYAQTTSAGFRVGVVSRGVTGSVLFDPAGAQVGTSGVVGSRFAAAPNGGVTATDGAYVRQYDATGREVKAFGDPRVGNDPSPTGGPFHFYQQGGAAVGPDGTTYVADATRGIHAASPEGFWRGVAADDALGKLTEASSVAVVGDRLYFAAGGRFNGNQHIAWISLADAAALRSAPREPSPVLGFGAGVTTGVTGSYFPAGTSPSLTARFDPWWTSVASTLRLSYTIRDHNQMRAGITPAPVVTPLPTTAAGLAAVRLDPPAARPGAYEADVRLVAADGTVVGATCVPFSVGAPGHRLDFSALPAGTDFGGPAPARGVALADILGTGGHRASVDWSVLLPDVNGPMNFAAYDTTFADASREAAQRGVRFHVQVGDGDPTERGLVRAGTWGQRVRELVAHFKGTVHAWEAWNEPNITYGAADAYVNEVLRPFTQAVKAADPGATVVGGSAVGVDVSFYDAIGRAGGYPLMDVVAIHPYGSHNRSFEEQGTPAAMARLRSVLAAHGAGAKPIWNTEFAWWSDGPGSYLAQADKVARGLVWNRVLGIDSWSYFIPEGGWGDWDVTFSLIEAAGAVDYVKPGALSAMTAAGQLAGRSFVAMVDTGIPHTYAASFGPPPGGSDSLLVAWSDDEAVDAVLSADSAAGTVTLTDEFGHTWSQVPSTALPMRLPLSGAPVYVTAPSASSLRLRPVEAFGVNVASAAAGARAVATSAGPSNQPAGAIDGNADALNNADVATLPAWASAPGDTAPALTVTLAQPTSLNRVVVATHSVASTAPGLRTYDVAVQENGSWVTVGQVVDQFADRRHLVSFPARTATAVRVSVANVNYSGYAGGIKPWFWPTDPAKLSDPAAPWHGPAVIYELEAYAGAAGGGPAPSPTTTTTTPPPAPAPAPAPGATTGQAPQGDWRGSYGADGYALLAWNGGSDVVSMPKAALSVDQAARHQWGGDTTDRRALQSPDGATRRATTAYDGNAVRLRLTFPAAYTGTVHLYAVDYDSTARRQSVTVDDGSPETVNVTTAFDQGLWVHAPVTVAAGGSVTVTATRTAGPNALVAGVFLGGPAPAPPAPTPTPPPAPTGLSATAVSTSRIDLAWTATPGATSHNVERSLDARTWTVVGTSAGRAYSDTGLKNRTLYYYRVRAVATAGESAPSAVVSARTKK